MTAPSKDRLSTAEARGQFSELVNRAAYGKERVVLTRRGKALAAVVPVEDLALLESIEDAQDSVLVGQRVTEWEAAGRPGVSLEDYIRERGLDVPTLEE